MAGALEGIRVVDLGHVLAGPTCTMILADLGAEVIKIEPFKGDDSRQFGPFVKEKDGSGTQSGYFISINRNKKSICLDLKAPEGSKILRELIRVSDVVVENYRPGTFKKLGFSFEEIQTINPGIVYCSISGYGHDTIPEYAAKPAYDMVAQAYSGLMSITGPQDGSPCRVGTSIGDLIGGHQAVIGILSALWRRQHTGRGQHVDISMVDGLISVLENAIARYLLLGEVPGPMGTAHPTITPFQALETGDGWIVVAIGNDKLWADFCKALDCPELAENPEFLTNPLRNKNRLKLIPILENITRQKTYAEWAEILDRYGLPFSPVNTIDKVVEDSVVKYRKMIAEIEQPRVGPMKIVGSPFKLSETPGTVRTHAPLLGEHTEEVLKEVLGYTLAEIRRLREKNVVR